MIRQRAQALGVPTVQADNEDRPLANGERIDSMLGLTRDLKALSLQLAVGACIL